MSLDNLTPNQRAFCENQFRHSDMTANKYYERIYQRLQGQILRFRALSPISNA